MRHRRRRLEAGARGRVAWTDPLCVTHARPDAPGEAAAVPRQPRLRSALVVLVVAAPPDARLVAPLGCAVEPLVHAPEAIQSARIGGIGVVDDAVLERERAHARPFARVRGRVGSAHGREDDGPLVATSRTLARLPPRLAPSEYAGATSGRGVASG